MLKNNFNRNLLISLLVHLLVIYLLVFTSDIKSSTNYNMINSENVIKINALDYKDINKYQALKDKKKREALIKNKRLAELKRKEEALKKKKLVEENKIKLAREKKDKKNKILENEKSYLNKLLEDKKKEIKKEEEIKKENLRKEENTQLAKYEEKFYESELDEIEKANKKIIFQKKIKKLSLAETEYIYAIQTRIESNWRKPFNVNHTDGCDVELEQLPSGKIISVNIIDCSANDLYIKSLENAVYRSSPLPLPNDPEIFESKIVLHFEGDNE